MAPTWPNNAKGKQIVCPTMSHVEIGSLEAYPARKLQGKGTVGGKANGKGTQVAFICKWGDCQAGCNQTPTYGQTLCIGCKR